jgi:hypothetical protein
MPSFYPKQPETDDTPADAELRASARKLADDIELVGAKVRVLANSETGARLAHSAELLNSAVRSLRDRADKSYPGPHPEPWRSHVMDMEYIEGWLSADGAADHARAVVELRERLRRLNADWPNFDAFTLRRLRGAADEGDAGAAAVLKAVLDSGKISEDSMI